MRDAAYRKLELSEPFVLVAVSIHTAEYQITSAVDFHYQYYSPVKEALGVIWHKPAIQSLVVR